MTTILPIYCDDNIVLWKLKCETRVEKSERLVRQYHKANYNEMRTWLSKIKWQEELHNLDLNEKWEKFCSIMTLAVDKYVPLAVQKSKKFLKWMNKRTKSARKYKTKMWKKYRQSNEYNDKVEYKRAQNKAVKEYRKAKRNFERSLAKSV